MKYRKITKKHHIIFLIALTAIFMLAWGIFYQNSLSAKRKIQIEKTQDFYKSKILKYQFAYPEKYKLSETTNTITIRDDSKSIVIDKIYGYSNSTKEYIEDLVLKNKLEISQLNNESEYGFDVYTINFEINESQEILFIKNIDTDTFVSISTSSPELYDELEQIAASFEYLGNSEN